MKGDGIVIALGKPKAGADDSSSEEMEGVGEDAKAAAQDFLDAIKSNDAEAVALAFSALKGCC